VMACGHVNPAVAQQGPFSKIFEAEKAVVSGARVQTTYGGFTCTGYVAFVNLSNDYLEWQIVVPTAGEYTANFRYAFGTDGAGPLKVQTNGNVAGNFYPFFSTGSWTSWQTNSLRVVLKAGVNYLRLTSNGYVSPIIDHVKVVTVDAPTNVPTTSDCEAPFSRYFEAENAKTFGPIVLAEHPGYTGTGYLDFQNASNDYIEWTFDLPAAGWYEYEFRYANGSTEPRPLYIQVNGRDDIKAFPPFGSTGGWSNWQVFKWSSTFLQGRNTIRISSQGYSGPNVDHLRVTYQKPLPFSSIFEAENAKIFGATVSAEHPGYTGTGYVKFQQTYNNYIEWTFDLPAAGWYQFAFRYAYDGNERGEPIVPVFLQVNGSTSVKAFYPFFSTGGWSNWQVVNPRGDYFLQGRNTIRFLTEGYIGPNVDYLQVYQEPANSISAVEQQPAAAFPNPATDVLNVKLGAGSEKADVRLLSAEGVDKLIKLVRKEAEEVVFDVSGVAPGWYVLRVQRGKTVETKQIRIK